MANGKKTQPPPVSNVKRPEGCFLRSLAKISSCLIQAPQRELASRLRLYLEYQAIVYHIQLCHMIIVL